MTVISAPTGTVNHHWLRRSAVAAVLILVTVELTLGWPELSAAISQLHTPSPGWIVAALVAGVMAMSAYARMQRRLLLSAGLRVSLRRNMALAFAAHSLNETLPGGPAFSTRFNFQQMRRFGATPAVASWTIALSGILSATALGAITAVGALASNGTPPWLSLAGLTVVAVLVTAGVRQVTRRPERLEPAIRAVLARVNKLRHRPADEGLEHVRGFIGQLGSARLTPGHGAAAVAFAVLNWVFDAACLWMCFQAVSDDPISSTRLLLAFCGGMAAATLTIIPGGLGIIDNALILGLVAGGAGTAVAVAAVVLYRVISFGFIIGAGWIAWYLLRHRT